MKNALKIIVPLVFIASLCGGTLAFVYQKTLTPIKEAQENAQFEAIKFVLPSKFDSITDKILLRGDNKRDVLELYLAKKKDEVVGVAIKTSSNKGFGGKLDLIVGLYVDGRINKFKLLSNKETSGLGSKVEEEKFMGQLNGFNPRYATLRLRQDGGDVDAVTAATISSRAVLEAVDKAYAVYQKYKGEY